MKEKEISAKCNEMHSLGYTVVEIKQCRRNHDWFNILFYHQEMKCARGEEDGQP